MNILGLRHKHLGATESEHKDALNLESSTFRICSTTLIPGLAGSLAPGNGKGKGDLAHLSLQSSTAMVWKHGSIDVEGNGH